MQLLPFSTTATVKPQISSTLASRARVVVVGAGPVGIQFANKLSERRPDLGITVFGDEPRMPYDRVQLSSYLAGDLGSGRQLELRPPDEGGFDLRVGERITEIDPQAQRVCTARGEFSEYDALVLATGSRPRWPGIAGLDKAGVFAFRDLGDAEALAARQTRSRHTTVIGGGLLGLETARAMRRFNTKITIVEHAPHVMFNQLDAAAGATLAQAIRELGIDLRTRVQVTAVTGAERVTAIELSDGTELLTDTLIVAAGIVPNIEIARNAQLHVGRGVVVDDALRTSDPGIFAIGECAEHRDIVYGLVQPGFEQASVLAGLLCGESVQYTGSALSTRLKVLSVPVFSAGDVTVKPRFVETLSHQAADDQYRMINVDRGRLVGACSVGNWVDNARLEDHVRRNALVWPWQRARFRRTGELWSTAHDSAASWPASAIICNCTGVTRGQIGRLHRDVRTSPVAIAQSTRASTICGSCRPLLDQIAGGDGNAKPTAAWYLIAGLSLIVALLAATWVALPGAGYATSVQTPNRWDQFWYHTDLKEWSGYGLLSLAVVAGLLSVRKRLPEVTWLGFPSWRLVHVLVGLLLAGLLFVHTGYRPGHNLNAWLTLCFVLALFTGALLGGVVALEHHFTPRLARGLRGASVWAHVLVLWPLPVLLGFHVVKTYYF